jgi:hypothetical protein
MKNWFFSICFSVVCLSMFGAPVFSDVNNDPTLPAPAPILDAGWASDQINAAWVNSADSPYVYNLDNPAYFRITDDFIVGDQYKVFDFGNLILTTALNTPAVRTAFGDNADADDAWVSAQYQHGEIILGVGPHQLTVQGDGVGGIPAGFWTRMDTVPEPSTFVALLSIGAVVFLARRRR